jgi:GT2 family glycosyltransferase
VGPTVAPTPAEPVTPLERPPTFSIVIPTYQAAGTVAESIESALAQEQPACEVIVVDDGSTDRLEDALRPFRAKIELISKENGGGASALNAGAVAASGDFIAILDADDAYHPRRIAALSALGRARPDLDLITTDARFIVAEEAIGRFAANTPFAAQGQRTKIFESCFVGGWPAVRRERLLALGGFDESLRTGYDWDCWIRLLLSGARAGMVEQPYYEYRLNPSSLTASRVSSLWDRVRLLEKAAMNPDLQESERASVERAIRNHRSRAVIADARSRADGEESSRSLPRLALEPGIEPKARAAALLAVGFPPLARRLLPENRSAEQRLAKGGR